MSSKDQDWFREIFQSLSPLTQQALVGLGMADPSWLETSRPSYQPQAVYEASLWRGMGYLSAGAGLAPGYAFGFYERGARAGYWPAPEGAGPWTYAGREQYYQGKQAALGVSSSVFWSGYYQGRYGEEQPSWIRETQQRYDVSRAYWQFQQTWTPEAEAWTLARTAAYAFPEAWPLRAFGYGFYGAGQRLGAAMAVSPYAQGMTPEQLQMTSAGWAFQYPTWPEWFGSSVLEWTGMQVGSWAGTAALRAGLAGAGLSGALGAGWESLRGAAGISIMQPGLDILLENLGTMGARAIAGQPLFTSPQEQAQVLAQTAVGAGLIGLGAGVQYFGRGDLGAILGPQAGTLTGLGRLGMVGAQTLGYFAGYYPTTWAAERLGATPEQAVFAGWGAGQLTALGAGTLASRYLPHVAAAESTASLWGALGPFGPAATLAGIALTGVQLAYSLGLVAETGTPTFQPYIDVSTGELSPSPAGGPPAGGYAPAITMRSSVPPEVTQYNLAIQGIGAMFGTQMGALGARSQAAYQALNQAWDVYGGLYSGYQSTWDAYRAKTIDYNTVQFMGGLVGGAVTRALGVRAAMPDFGAEYQNIYATTASSLRRQVEALEKAGVPSSDLLKTWHLIWEMEASAHPTPTTLGLLTRESQFGGISQVSRYGPARQTFLQMEEGLVDITRPLGAEALAAIYSGLRTGAGWQGMGALTRQLETADILTGVQRSQMLGMAFVAELGGVGREWETSALIRQAGVGLTGVWWAAAGDKIAAAALKLELTGILDVPPGYTAEDVMRLRDSWRGAGEFDWRDPTQREEGGYGRRPTPTEDYYYYSSDVLQGQHGLDEIVTRRTTIVAGETGPEHVKVTPLTGGGRGELNSQIRSIVREELALATGRSTYDLDQLEWELSPLISKRIFRSITAKGV